jgi:TolB protein
MREPAPMVRRNRFKIALLTVALIALVGCGPVASVVRETVPRSVAPPAPNLAALTVAAPNVAAPPVQQAAETPSGRILFVRDGNLWLWNAGNSRQFSEGHTWYQPAFSPGGKEIAYVYWAENFSDIFVISADGSSTRRLTKGQSASLPDNIWAFRPSWSPDGERIAYVSDATSQFNQVWLISQDGGTRRQLTSEMSGFQWADSLTWEPSGDRIAVTAARAMGEPSHIYLIDVASGSSDKLSTQTNGAFDPAWSPDGETIAYIGRPGQTGELWVSNVDGTQTAHLDKLQYVRSPAWSPDGKSLAVLATHSGIFEIWIVPVKRIDGGYEFGEPRQLTREAAVDPLSGLTWAP